MDAIAGQVAAELLERSHLLAPDSITEALAEAALPLGISGVRIFLADLQQQCLRTLPADTGQGVSSLDIDSTIAGRAYRSTRIQVEADGDGIGGHRIWIPLPDGADRLGVLELIAGDTSEGTLARCRMLASLAGLIVAAKSSYSDTYARARRSGEMAPQAELARASIPPRTFATSQVAVSAAFGPTYELGGDAFDYSLLADRLHVSVFDATGHDLAAGLLASVAMASCRSSRRAGGTLPDIAVCADRTVAQLDEDRFVTALLCDLDIAAGRFAWISCGHPPPLLIRGHEVVKELTGSPQLPLGLAGLGQLGIAGDGGWPGEPWGDVAAQVCTEQLESGDQVLLYTDGVTEARAADGSRFGVEGVSDFIVRDAHAGTPPAEMLRRLNRAIVEYQDGQPADDSTVVLLEWVPGPRDRRGVHPPSRLPWGGAPR